MKKPEIYLKEYCQKLNEENLKWLHARLNQRLAADLSEVATFFEQVKEIDRWLITAEDNESFFGMLDLIQNALNKECEKRSNQASA